MNGEDDAFLAFPSSFGSLTLDLLIIALGIFVWLSARSRSIRSFQFQISVFISVWITGEIVDLLQEEYALSFLSYNTGMYVHVSAMTLFSAMLWVRFYLSQRSGKKMADTLEEN